MSKLLAKIKEEFLPVLPPTIFFFVALHIVALIRVLMNKVNCHCAVVHHFYRGRSSHSRQGRSDRGHVARYQSFSGKATDHNVAWKTAIYPWSPRSSTTSSDLSISGGRRAASSPGMKDSSPKSSGRTSGGPDHSARPDPDVLHDTGIGARNRHGQGPTHVFRPTSVAYLLGSLNLAGPPHTAAADSPSVPNVPE